ncbi:hypothetical protein HBO23_16355 [Pseudomonas sp. WS 5532]|uniref:Uncharacterized protein n=1 Tax=Pseudomonas edaphica TaxID=2006980 RepID=A0A7Y8E478_9PSED|nr:MULTISPECIES: hypothetical protein [Pseudomonas]NMX73024.1 hypothetical protein [Pseudomonas sp. WS 5532]NMX74530.1 hypothetical protein [Pseudomonas sp. WS 5532]NWC48030.1 hypothetical protein [Pseudomonas sp. IPO3747]NWE07722.1 hypothetical protein [Pseudomonas edaphica]
MNAVAKLKAWNFQVLMLVQAMLGAVTPNFRMVVLSCEVDVWVIRFYLEKNIEDDIAEIEDIICQYAAYQDSSLQCKSEILVGNENLPSFSEGNRAVYRRKE